MITISRPFSILPNAISCHSLRSLASTPPTSEFLTAAASGTGATTFLDIQKSNLSKLTTEIYQLNNNTPFNLNSPKQLSNALFGPGGGSTNKDVLDAMAGAGNPLAGKVLGWKKLSQGIKRQEATEARVAKRRESRSDTQNAAGPPSSTSPLSASEPNRDPLLLVDASAYIFRAYYAMPPLHRRDGTPTGAVLGVCNMINRLVLDRLIRGEQPRLVFVLDAKGRKFRSDIYENYKANRPPCPIDLVPQFDLVRAAATAFGIPQLESVGFEADDVIATLATLATQQGVNVNIISSDKDLMQLVTPSSSPHTVHLIDPMKQIRVDNEAVIEKWGVPPHLLGDVLALAGDSADNVPGIRGIGPKIAAELINEYGDLTNLLANADKIKQNKRRELLMTNGDVARMSRELVELIRDVPEDKILGMNEVPVDELRMEELDEDRLLNFFKEMGFGEMKRRTEARFRAGLAPRATGTLEDMFEAAPTAGGGGGGREEKEKEKRVVTKTSEKELVDYGDSVPF